MDFAKIDVEIRTQTGKGPARRQRAAGQVPAVLYGHKEETLSLALDPRALVKSLDKERKRNTVFTLTVKNGGQAKEVMAMIKDAHLHPISRQILHVDFVRVNLDEEVKVTVPVVLTGTPAGVVDGGNLHQSVHELRVAATPATIPSKVIVDVSALKIGEALHVSDLKLGTGVRALLHAEDGIASVVAPQAVVEAAPAAEAAAAAGATPAEGEKAGDKAAGDKGGDKAAAKGGDKGDKK
jgi:large subunit ribosomal protein L25